MNEQLREQRNKKGITVRLMAKKLGITPGYYSMIETGKRRVNYPLAYKIAQELETSPDSLFLEFQSTISKQKEAAK